LYRGEETLRAAGDYGRDWYGNEHRAARSGLLRGRIARSPWREPVGGKPQVPEQSDSS